MEGGPPAKRRRRCTNRSDFLEDEEWSTPVSDRSTPVRQLDGSSSRFKFDSKEESNDDSNGKWSMEGSGIRQTICNHSVPQYMGGDIMIS